MKKRYEGWCTTYESRKMSKVARCEVRSTGKTTAKDKNKKNVQCSVAKIKGL
jgi:hypothetical protein